MDALTAYKRDDAIVSKPPSLVYPSNDGSKVESPVSKLPTELIMLIFQQYRLLIGPPITLTHISRRWRIIAVNGASLWTDIVINTRGTKRNADSGHFLSFLGMQLDRTANLPLDVTWHTNTYDGFFTATLKMLREKAPFFRWRTLRVALYERWEDVPWCSEDAFTGLESLQILGRSRVTILGVIDRSITSRLKVLDSRAWHGNIKATFASSLTHISSLVLSHIADTSLPENVLNLQLDEGRQHLFPHLQTYKLAECILYKETRVDLRSMTTFIVRGLLTIHSDCQVLFPALRKLRLRALRVHISASIEAPALDILQFMHEHGPGVTTAEAFLPYTDGSLLEPGYLLSPNASISADSYLSSTAVIALLTKSPKVTTATLRFTDWTGAQAVLTRLVIFGAETDSISAEDDKLCPRLSKLTLDFGWRFSDSLASKAWLLDALKARKGAGITPSLSIYAGWRGEGTYVLLTDE